MKNIIEVLISWKNTIFSLLIKLKENKDLLIYLMFFLVATGLWFLNALRKEYVTTITYPVKYSDFPDDYILHGATQDKLELKIRAQGYSLLPYHMGKSNSPLFLSVSNFKIKKVGNIETAFVLSREYLNTVSSRLANNVELLEIFPDTLSVNLDRKERKMVAVEHQSNISYQNEYNNSGDIELRPQMVEVSGPASIIDTITVVKLNPKDYTNLKDSVNELITLRKLENLSFMPNQVALSIPVEAFTEKKIDIPVLGINLPDTLVVRTFPTNISLTCRVPASRFNEIDEFLFHAVVDYDSYIGSGLPDKLKVRLLRKPKGIYNVSYSPLFVECLFEKK